MSRTTIAGLSGGSLLALFAFLGPEPIGWPRAAVLVAGCIALAALGIFAHEGPPVVPAAEAPRAVDVPRAPASRPEADIPPTVGP